MDSNLYKAAMGSNNNVLQNKDLFELQLTPNNNTVLHVAALFGNTNSLIQILNLSPTLARRVNSKGETALHIASREGHSDIVRALIEFAKALDEELENGVGTAKEMLRMTSVDKDTALHEAVRNHHFVVAQLLTQADPEFVHPANNSDETPLYLAAERGYVGLVSEILTSCRSPTNTGPSGRTALHATVLGNFEGCTTKLLDWKPSLTKETDQQGWTPLHYAARFGYLARVKQLLNIDKSIAYIAEKDEQRTALHIAAAYGHVNVMEELISNCPDCWEMVDNRGQNVLHIAVENEKERVIEFLLRNFSLRGLINQKDGDGNTALHLIAASEMYEPHLILHPGADKMAFNKENLTPLDVVYSDKHIEAWGFTKRDLIRVGATLGRRDVISRDKDDIITKKRHRRDHTKFSPVDMRRTADTHLIVAALIATFTFAACFTVPGGYDSIAGSDRGTAILTRKTAFKMFVIADTIAMTFSITAVFIYFIVADDVDRDKLVKHYTVAYCLIIIAMEAMLIAFITGMYAVLTRSSSLAISVCVISCFSFPANYILLRNAWHGSS